MEGVVLTFDNANGNGMIRGSDGSRYQFSDRDWMDRSQHPTPGQRVDFDSDQGWATGIVVTGPTGPASAPAASALGPSSQNGSLLGIASIVLAVLGLLPAFGILLSIIGLVVGILGRRQAVAAKNQSGITLSTIGIVLACVTLAAALVIILIVGGILGSIVGGGFR